MPKFDIYETIANRILESLEQGIVPWKKPWIGTAGAISYETRKPYSLLNQFMVGEPGEYLTFKQVQKHGGKVKKGAKSRMVVFYGNSVRETEDSNGNKKVRTFPVLRYYNVFHINDTEGIEPHTEIPNPEFTPDEQAENVGKSYIERENIGFRNNCGDRCFYSPSNDEIVMPYLQQFKSKAEYYAAMFHEMVHSTGHKSRLDRLDTDARFGTENYSKEELVAEIGAAAIVNRVGLESVDQFRNSTAYIQGWMRKIREDKKLIVSAAGKADKAVKYIFDGKGA